MALYRSILRAAHKFEDYNFRAYFMRRAREDWRQPVRSENFEKEQRNHLHVLQRQAVISSFYPSPTYENAQN
eukprot:CAMPEP_0178999848 /NCGR_PEP_ID=MMETSP0795-20121207/10326_1 /TAXON_ID=88552 /ORGANISM="Amoebophrya sp., Strain Ameob2" /LENGTH=71 /DNA_ID=CAMNT_0020692743 /DNA_START=177 /DNA_END=389 /DNA_ORIENTATION=+